MKTINLLAVAAALLLGCGDNKTAPDARVRIEVVGDRPATLSVDGNNLGTLYRGDAITCTAASGSARFVTFGPRNFLRILKTKFGLSDR